VRVGHPRRHLPRGPEGHHRRLDVLLHVRRPLRDGRGAGVGRHVGVRGHVPAMARRGGRRVVVGAVRGREVGGVVAGRGRAVAALVAALVRALGPGGGGGAGPLHADGGAGGRAAGERHPGAAHVPLARLHQLLVLGPAVLEPDLHLKQKGVISDQVMPVSGAMCRCVGAMCRYRDARRPGRVCGGAISRSTRPGCRVPILSDITTAPYPASSAAAGRLLYFLITAIISCQRNAKL
jgi:hypothetical protein